MISIISAVIALLDTLLDTSGGILPETLVYI